MINKIISNDNIESVSEMTKRIQNAIDTVSLNGGGTIYFPSGEFISGTLILKSNIRIELEMGAVLRASPNIEDYRKDVHHNRYSNEEELDRCFIFSEDQVNITICGDGEINGNNKFFNYGIGSKEQRPMLIRILRCSNVKLRDIKLYDSSSWTTAFLDSKNIWIANVEIHNNRNYNGDGLDFDGCKNIYIDACKIDGTDDNLCLQASCKDYPVENVHITNCSFSSICAGIRIGLKSIGTIRDVLVSNCSFERVWREGVKIECSEGGRIENILFNNLSMKDVSRPIFIILNNRLSRIGSSLGLNHIPKIGKIRNINFSNIMAYDSVEMLQQHFRFGDDLMGANYFNGVRIDASKENPIEGVTLSNFVYDTIGGVDIRRLQQSYPSVIDISKLKKSDDLAFISENYYPDWSRATFMDIRNVNGLILNQVTFSSRYMDTRKPIIIESTNILKNDVRILNKEY